MDFFTGLIAYIFWTIVWGGVGFGALYFLTIFGELRKRLVEALNDIEYLKEKVKKQRNDIEKLKQSVQKLGCPISTDNFQ